MMYFQTAVVTLNAFLGIGMLFVLFSDSRQTGAIVPGPARRLVGKLLIYVACAIFLFSGTLKLAHVPQVVEEMASLQMTGWKLDLVGALELTTGALFLVRRLRSIGLLVASAYLGGAICSHLAADQYFAAMPTMFVLGCCWLGCALRHPQILWSLTERGASQPQPQPQLLGFYARPIAR